MFKFRLFELSSFEVSSLMRLRLSPLTHSFFFYIVLYPTLLRLLCRLRKPLEWLMFLLGPGRGLSSGGSLAPVC